MKHGPLLSIVDFSAAGAQVDVDGYHLRPGTPVILEIAARAKRLNVRADVLRCRVLALANSIRYRGALEFQSPVELTALADDGGATLVERRRTAAPDGARMELIGTWTASPTPAAAAADADGLPVGWNRIVVRYADGRLAKGYCQDFFPPRGHFQLWRAPSTSSTDRVMIPIGDLKAVFFVRDFAGNPAHAGSAVVARPASGRTIAVTFLDDEEIVGTTMNYQPGALGFFIQPLDSNGNNLRAYVVSRAVRHVRFL